MDETARAAAAAAGFSEDQFRFLDNLYTHHGTQMDAMRQTSEGAMASILRATMASGTQPARSTTFEVDTKFGRPTNLDKSGLNYEEFAFKFKAHVA